MDSMHSTHRVNYQLRAHRRDNFVEFIKSMTTTPFVMYSKGDRKRLFEQYEGVFECLEDLVCEHREAVAVNAYRPTSRLKELVPQVGRFFTELPLVKAFCVYDGEKALTGRKFVPPSFNDIRHILNIAQVLALTGKLRLITFDGDQTLYQDGGDFDPESNLVKHIVDLLSDGIFVALVTAAGYENAPEKYESRLSGLLEGFQRRKLPVESTTRFFVMGAECNFLYRCRPDYHLEVVEYRQFATAEMRTWDDHRINRMLDIAEQSLQDGIERMKLPYFVLRKARGVGMIKKDGDLYVADREQLDELALCAKHEISEANLNIPFCAFNGGQDVWVDVGNKLIGVHALQEYLQCAPEATLHVGDQFLSTGNDIATRGICCTVWVSKPEETDDILKRFRETTVGEP